MLEVKSDNSAGVNRRDGERTQILSKLQINQIQQLWYLETYTINSRVLVSLLNLLHRLPRDNSQNDVLSCCSFRSYQCRECIRSRRESCTFIKVKKTSLRNDSCQIRQVRLEALWN
jgi:hypothetical protein